MCLPSTERVPHALHADGRIWGETNCYTDLWIELLHGHGHDPVAMLPFTLAADFEGDQWTFFKPSHADLATLYGADVQELAIWRPLVEHVVEQLSRGHPVLVELDAWFLPDTSGSAYRLQHAKTMVAVDEIEVDRKRLGYFHNAGYFELEGEDFAQLFHLDGVPHERVLPPYAEFVKWRGGGRRNGELVEASVACAKAHVGRIPVSNPFAAFRERFAADLGWLLAGEIGRFHAYAFVTWRQYGACFELASSYLRWLAAHGVDDLDGAADDLHGIAGGARTLQFQLARAVARGKPIDLAPLQVMEDAWTRAMDGVRQRLG
jgi:hypothetical protein